jgi:hypothetical protein
MDFAIPGAILGLSLIGCAHVPRESVAQLFGAELSLADLVPPAEETAQKATLAPGEFPAWLQKSRCTAVEVRVWSAVFDDYVKKHSLQASPSEIERCARSMQKSVASDWDPKDGPVPLDLEFATHWIQRWKRDVSLHREFGGRVIFQQFGVEPVDAWRKVLEQYESKQAFVFRDPALRACVYQYFENQFSEIGPEETKKFLARPMCFED